MPFSFGKCVVVLIIETEVASVFIAFRSHVMGRGVHLGGQRIVSFSPTKMSKLSFCCLVPVFFWHFFLRPKVPKMASSACLEGYNFRSSALHQAETGQPDRATAQEAPFRSPPPTFDVQPVFVQLCRRSLCHCPQFVRFWTSRRAGGWAEVHHSAGDRGSRIAHILILYYVSLSVQGTHLLPLTRQFSCKVCIRGPILVHTEITVHSTEQILGL